MAKNNYVLDSSAESDRLEKQSKTKAFDVKSDLRYLDIKANQSILDAGCGTGIATQYLAQLAPGVKVAGWDYSEHQITAATKLYGHLSNVTFERKNLLDLDTDTNGAIETFDVVVCRYVLRHFKSEDTHRVLQNLVSLLKPGGQLYCVDVDGVMGEVFPASPFLKKSLESIREARTVDFQVARKMPSLLIQQGFDSVDWHLDACEFKGEALHTEIENLKQSIKNAETFVRELVGGDTALQQFQQEYFSALTSPGFVLSYTKVVAMGIKPVRRLQVVR